MCTIWSTKQKHGGADDCQPCYHVYQLNAKNPQRLLMTPHSGLCDSGEVERFNRGSLTMAASQLPWVSTRKQWVSAEAELHWPLQRAGAACHGLEVSRHCCLLVVSCTEVSAFWFNTDGCVRSCFSRLFCPVKFTMHAKPLPSVSLGLVEYLLMVYFSLNPLFAVV